MNLVEQITLVFARGRTEKVYEIDLCTLGPDRFLVNFRYGRRGKPLKEGTKTVDPVPEARARAIFQKLVDQQQAKGYTPGASHAPTPEPEPPPQPAAPAPAPTPAPARSRPAPAPAPPRLDDPRANAVLARLARGDRRRSRDDARAARQADQDVAPRRRSRREIQAELRAQRRSGGRNRGRNRQRVRRRGDGSWSLTRAIWRAGELKLAEAVPTLIGLIGTGTTDKAMRAYCIAWALGRCGDASAAPALRRMHADPGQPTHVVRAAAAALLMLLTGADRDRFVAALSHRLPASLKDGDAIKADGLTDALKSHLAGPAGDDGDVEAYGNPDRRAWAALETLYLIGSPPARAAVMAVVHDAPLRPPVFQRLRAIFKIAELRRDGQMFGKIAWRFAKTRAMYAVNDRGRAWVTRPNGRTQRVYNARQQVSRSDASLAYGSKTRQYFRRRVWHTLRRMGELDDRDYVPMAAGVLLAFSDGDGPSFDNYWAFNQVIHGASDRFYRGNLSFRLRHQPTYSRRNRRRRRQQQQQQAPVGREEMFGDLWDAMPAGLMQLVAGSKCEVVHEFAIKALKDQTRFMAALPAEAIALIVSAPYKVSTRFGYEHARARFDAPNTSDADRRGLATAVADCGEADLRRAAHGWIRRDPGLMLDDPAALARLAASRHSDTQAMVRDLLRPMRLDDGTARTLMGAIVAHLMGLDQKARAEGLMTLLDEVFGDHLADLGAAAADLAGHRLMVVQQWIGTLMSRRVVPLVPGALTALLNSPHDGVRVVGIRLLGRLDDRTLAEAGDLLWSSLTSKDAAVREAARPSVKRLAQTDRAFAGRILQMLIASLLRRKLPEGVPAFVVRVLREDFAAQLTSVPAEVVWRLLRSKEGAAQQLGGILLPHHLDPQTVDIAQLVELAGHEVKAVRNAAWNACRGAVGRLKRHMVEAVALLDSDWEDTRLFAFELFETRFVKADFEPAVLVSICDSVRPDVQRFGRNLIAKHFDPSHGREYLLKLSEHPSSDVQLFASSYLRDYASGDVAALEALAPYFIRVLCGINRGRAAKQRAHAFLRTEALAAEDRARVVARILGRQSATTAIEDRAACIETLAAIAHAWPAVELPLRINPPALRGAAVAGGA